MHNQASTMLEVLFFFNLKKGFYNFLGLSQSSSPNSQTMNSGTFTYFVTKRIIGGEINDISEFEIYKVNNVILQSSTFKMCMYVHK